VGGALRDELLGRPVRDFDVVVARSLDEARGALPEAHAVGSHVPILLLPGSSRVEVTGFRSGARTLDEDLALRDFSVNAIAFSRSEGWADPLGGRVDLAARRLRASEPGRAFRDDPVRVLRGARLAVELGMTIEPETERALERAAWRLGGAPGERLREELFRLLALERGVLGVEYLRRHGGLAALLPELLRGVGVGQNRHHRDDVYRHTLRVCAALPPDPLLRLAGLLHDVAKPETKGYRGRKGEVSFHRHEHVAGAHLARVAARLRLSRHEHSTLERLVRHHLLFEERLETDAAVRRMLRRVGRDILEPLLALRRADLVSRGPVPASWEDCERRIRERANRDSTPGVPTLAITGEDVMRELDIEAGPEVGRWLARAERRIVEDPELNLRASLLDWLRRAAGDR
jgi:tRNA nucleotidyltransferase/poly(A) polymerase